MGRAVPTSGCDEQRRPRLGKAQGRLRGPVALPADAVAEGRSRASRPGRRRGAAGAGRQGDHARHALRLQGGGRRDERRSARPWTAALMLVVAYAGARFGGVLADNLRNALFEKVGQNAARRLAARVFRHVHALQPALPPRAAHRQPDQDRRARHQEHRHDALFPAVQHRPDGDRADRHLRHLLREVRAGTGRRDAGDGRALHRLHPQGDRLAHPSAARDERGRQQGDRPRGRQPAQLRDGQIFRRRGARGAALRRGDRAASPGPRSSNEVSLAWLNIGQSLITNLMMAGRDGLHRLGLEPGALHAGRRGAGQQPADAAVPPARHARLGLSLDPPGADRHGGDVRPDRHAGRGGRRARRAGAGGRRRPCPVRGCRVRL